MNKGVKPFQINNMNFTGGCVQTQTQEGQGEKMADETKVTLEAVQQFFETNKEDSTVQEFKNTFINTQSVNGFLETEEGKKLIQPTLDRNFTKGLETWKNNHLQGLIDQKLQELNPAETEADKQLREMQQRLDAMEAEKTMASLKANAVQEMQGKGLPTTLADFMIGDSLETTRDKINQFEVEYKNAVKAEVENRLKGNGGTPNHSGGEGNEGMTKAKLQAMNYNDRLAFYNKNPELYTKIMNG